MKLNESVIKFITKLQNIVRQLKDIDEKISDTQIMIKILSGLQTKFSAFYTQEILLKEERRIVSSDENLVSACSLTT